MLIVFGSINIDNVYRVPQLPRAGDTVWAEGARNEPGGRGANQAVAARRDGAAVTLVGAVGHDVLADAALAGLKKDGVALGYVARVSNETGRAAICVDRDGYTTVVADAGANQMVRAAQVPDALLTPRTTLLVQLDTDPTEIATLIARAKRHGCRIILDLSPRRFIDTDALRSVDILLGNSPELAWAGHHLGTGDNPGSLHAALGVTTIRMMGAQGVEAMSDDGFLHMPAYPVHMRDTTGASDCFAGVLAGSLTRGMTLPAAMRRAAVAAALSTTHVGAQRSMPHAADIDAALRTAPELTDRQPEAPD